VPVVLVGSPKAVYMQLFYAPSSLLYGLAGPDAVTLDLKRFGLTIAGQLPGGVFQLAFRGNGYVGKETIETGTDRRMILGLDALTVSIGSRIKETVSIGIEGGAKAKIDTLVYKTNPAQYDRYFDGQVPVIGGFVNVKREGLPVASAFSFTTGTSRFVYVTRNDIDQDPIKGDSLAWKWQTAGNIDNANITYHPALFLGYRRNKYQVYAHTARNDNLDVGDKLAGHDWKIADFCFGIGSSVEIAEYAKTWVEFSRSTIGLEYGNAWPGRSDRDTTPYNRFCIGVETALHSIPRLNFPVSIETFVRLGYFNLRENSAFNGFQSEIFGLGNSVGPDSRTYRYVPDFGVWGQNQRIIGTTLGLGATFLNRMFSVDSYTAFLSKGSVTPNTGYEFGINAGYCFK
jgi:hypothetical protein